MSSRRARVPFGTRSRTPAEIYPYGFAQTSGELDDALQALYRVFQDMLELAQVGKDRPAAGAGHREDPPPGQRPGVCDDPGDAGNIRYITMKLEENERGNTTRLMKVKDMVLQDAHHYKS